MIAYLENSKQVFTKELVEAEAGINDDQSFEEYEEEGEEEDLEKGFSEEQILPAKPKASSALLTLLKRLLIVAADRLHKLCLRLNIQEDVCESIWSLFKKLLIFESDLLKERTLDQVLICSVICGLSHQNRPLSFSTVFAE